MKLLCRLYDPTEGQILLDGTDIREYDYDAYLKLFSFVFQDFKLFALPLGENIAASGAYDVQRAEECIRKAARFIPQRIRLFFPRPQMISVISFSTEHFHAQDQPIAMLIPFIASLSTPKNGR